LKAWIRFPILVLWLYL